jgi:diguanylate cyclase (GGDEF)-like protein/PAS domain S-box-containing protein
MMAKSKSEYPQGQRLATLLRLAVAALPLTAAAFVCRVGGEWEIRASLGWDAVQMYNLLAAHSIDVVRALEANSAIILQTIDGGAMVRVAALACIEANGFRPGLLIAVGSERDWDDGKAQQVLTDLAQLATDDIVDGTPVTLSSVVDAFPEPVAIFDEAGRFLHWNKEFEDVYTAEGAKVHQGLVFEDHLRNCLANGLVVDAKGREETWLKNRLERFKAADSVTEHQLSNGRWVRVQDRSLPGGGRVGLRTDITEFINSQASLRLLFDANPMPMLVIDRATLKFLAVNDAAVGFYGYSREDFLNLSLPDIRPEKTPGEIRGMIDRFADPAITDIPRYHLSASGEPRVVKVNARLLDYEGTAAILAAIFDVTQQQKMEEELRSARSFLKKIVDHVPTAMFAKDVRDGRYVFYNPAAEEVFGRSSTAIIGHTTEEVFPEAEAARLKRQDEQALRAGSGGIVGDEYIVRPDGARCIRIRRVGISDGTSQAYRYILGVAEDVTEQRAYEAHITHLASHDTLTGLANRALFLQRLDESVAGKLGDDAFFAVHFIDLDGFKSINDTFGHAVGDLLLQSAAERMQQMIGTDDLVARFGGDEFAVLQKLIGGEAEAHALASRLVSVISELYMIDRHECRISASIGVSFATNCNCAPGILLEQADAALYSAKRSGRDRYVISQREL